MFTSLRSSLANGWHCLIEPSAAIVQTERRLLARMLMAMLLVLIILDLISLTFSLLGFYDSPWQINTTLNQLVEHQKPCLAGGCLLAIEYRTIEI